MMRTFKLKPNQLQDPLAFDPARAYALKSVPQLREENVLHTQRAGVNRSARGALPTLAEESDAGLRPGASLRSGHDFSRVPAQAPALQAKLAINAPGDKYEREADRVAEQLMRASGGQVQRACACGGGVCSKCESGEEAVGRHLQKGAGAEGGLHQQAVAPPIVNEAVRSAGQPLDPSDRRFFEESFGRDFSRVRVHADGKASASARSVNALAYTVGTDIVFGAGQYRPREGEGMRLLAHELTHVCQQSAAPAASLQRQEDPTQQTAPTPNQPRSDAIVQAFIDDALTRKGTVEAAFRDLQSRRCVAENCGDENLAAAEHYMFARWWVQESAMPELMALFMAGAITAYQLVKYIGMAPSQCPEICPVTPASAFQWGWAIAGVEDGAIVARIPAPPPGYGTPP